MTKIKDNFAANSCEGQRTGVAVSCIVAAETLSPLTFTRLLSAWRKMTLSLKKVLHCEYSWMYCMCVFVRAVLCGGSSNLKLSLPMFPAHYI